ncbi:hypothetical protein EBH_0004060 [Eimeria brunetti]|uniref:Folylpolyglutamate synthase n=1 Tax=Eimeria brunetti TaxID=51314 RepID=U6LQS5_9EIME|nr:hypothetical protein EBH_0004060 [Eimeria brunetti]
MKLGLEGVEKVAGVLGDPHLRLKVVHVAGTNGKGSVCTKVASCLMEKGGLPRGALHFSPFVLSPGAVSNKQKNYFRK